jgi:hypothetical protein
LYEDCEGYEHWKICTYDKRTPETKTELMHQVSTRYNSDGFSCSEDTYIHELNLIYEPTGQPVKVYFHKDTGHQITLESMVFGRKKSEERANRELYKKVSQKLPWAQRGFVWKNGTWVPIPKRKPLRQK